jgi:hypothetical protein
MVIGKELLQDWFLQSILQKVTLQKLVIFFEFDRTNYRLNIS